MSCCGGTRTRVTASRPARPASAAEAGAPAPRASAAGSVQFEYSGRTSLTVIGLATRARYRFAWPGARLAVNARDAAYLNGVPNLRRVQE